MKRAGVSYFGVRILRHVRRDLQDVAARGYAAVLRTVSENDLAYYRGTMADLVAASHELGLEVQMCPWGLGRTFGGEAESRWVTFHPDACQVLDDGRRVATGCLNQPAYRAFCKEWADAALEAGTDYVFWDEPHWTVPEHVGIDDSTRWACCCEVCRERAGGRDRGSLDLGLRGLRAHDAPRDARRAARLGSRDASLDGTRRARAEADARPGAFDQRRRRHRRRRGRARDRRDRGRGRRDRRAARGRRPARVRRRRDVGPDRGVG